MSRVILCTGGIGSGKSYVVEAFRRLGVPAYDCDRAAKDLYDRDPQLLAGMVTLCGEGILGDSGRLDRRALAALIFSDTSLLSRVEALVHPAVIRDFERWKAEQDAPVLLIESAILLEKPLPVRIYDEVLAVVAPDNIRTDRVQKRDFASEEEVRQRMSLQMSNEELAARADYVLNNDGRQSILPEIIRIIENGKD